MKRFTTKPTRLIALSSTLALVAATWLASIALAEGTCGVPNSAADCFVDSRGCEITQGFVQSNSCNSPARGDGKYFWVSHTITTTPLRSGFRSGGSGSSSYVALYCSNNLSTALFRGQMTGGTTQTCDPLTWPVNYAFRSVCGPNSACME